MITRSYSELIRLPTAEERFRYLQLSSVVGETTFGFDRQLNQSLYTSKDWRDFRRDVILRDHACDMALPDREIPEGTLIIIHHINPLTLEDLECRSDAIFDMNNVVCVTDRTHRAIHFGDISQINLGPVERKPNDTCPWKSK